MKIKWNWGTKLVIAMGAFMLMVISMVVFMIRQDVSLVEKDYYPRGKAHQEKIDRLQNTLPYVNEIIAVVENDAVVVSFPAFFEPATTEGLVHAYHRVSDAGDRFLPLLLDQNNRFSFPLAGMQGRYILKITWHQNGIAYYTEKNIDIE